MAQFIAYEKGIEIFGANILATMDGMGVFKDRALKILAQHGISDLQPESWYSLDGWLAAFKEIHDTVGAMTLYRIGKKVPEKAQFPPQVDTIEKALGAINISYHMNHRKSGKVMFDPTTGAMEKGIGSFQLEMTGPRSARMTCHNPYPSDFDRGIIETIANKFKPADTDMVMVERDPDQPSRLNGAESCVFLINW